MALISTKVKELHTFLYNAGLTDLTESVFRKEFEDVRFQDEVFLKMTSTDPPAYVGSKEHFIANYVVTSEDRLPEKLSTSQISIYDDDGVEQTLKRRSDRIAQSRDVTNAINGLRTTLSDMSTNSAFSDRAKEAASGLSITGSGDLYNIVDANGATISTIDYSGFTSYSERSNILNNALTDVSDYLQQFDIDAYKNLMGGNGLNYSYVGPNSRRVRLKKAGDFELTELPPAPAKGTRLSKAGDFELTTVSDIVEEQQELEEEGGSLVAAPTMTGAITAEDISHYSSRFGNLGANGFENIQLAKGEVSFEYADIMLNKGDFSLNERIKEINEAGGTEITINGQVYNIESVTPKGEAGGNLSLVLVGKTKLTEREESRLTTIQSELKAREVDLEYFRSNPDQIDVDQLNYLEERFSELKEEEDQLLDKSEGQSQTIQLTQLGGIQQFAIGSESISQGEGVAGSVNRVLEGSREIINDSTPEGISEFSQEVTTKVIEQVNALPEDAEMTMTLYENGETVTRNAESKAEYSNYLISRYFNEAYKGIEKVEELKDVVASVEAGTYIRINGNDYDMDPFDQQSFLLEDADYMLSDLLVALTTRGKGSATGTISMLFAPTDVPKSDLRTIRGITDYRELETWYTFKGDSKGEATNYYNDRQEEIEKFQKNLAIYYNYYADLYQLSMLNGDAASAAKAKLYADNIEEVSNNMFSSDRFKSYVFVTDYLDSEKKRIENSSWATRTLYNSAATVTNSASNLAESVMNLTAGAAGIAGAGDFSQNLYNLSEDMDQFYNTYSDFSKTSKFQGADMGGGDYVEYEGYRVYVDGDGNPTKVYTEDLQHVGQFDKTQIINKILEDASFQDRTVKSSNWWSGSSATGYVGAAMGSVSDLYFAGAGTKLFMGAGRIANVARPLTSKLPKASFLSTNKAMMVKQRLTQATVFTGMMYNDIKNEARASGFTEEEANRYSWAVSGSIGAVNALIFPGTEQFFGGLTNTTARTTILAASKKIGTDKLTAAGMKKAAEVTIGAKLKSASKGFIVEGAKETLEEVVFENAAQMLYHNYAAELSENEIEAYKVTMDDARNTAIISFAVGGSAGGMNAKSEISNINNMARMDFDDLMFEIAKKPSSARSEIERLQKKGIITSDVAAELTTNLEYAERSINNMSSKLREKPYISAVYRAEMRAQRLDAEASTESNETIKEYKTNQAKSQRELAQALTVVEAARRTGDSAYILNGKVVSRTEMDNFFANKDASSPLLKNATYEIINDNDLSNELTARFEESYKETNISAIVRQGKQTSTLKLSRSEEIKQRKRDRENQKNGRMDAIAQASQEIEINQQRINRFEDSRQEDGSFVFDSKPEDGIKYTEKEVDGKTQYVVSKREGEKFIRNTKAEISKQEGFIELNEYTQSLEDSLDEQRVDMGDVSFVDAFLANQEKLVADEKAKGVKNRKGNYEFKEKPRMPHTEKKKGILSRRTVYEVSKEDFEAYDGSINNQERTLISALKKVSVGDIKGMTDAEVKSALDFLNKNGEVDLVKKINDARGAVTQQGEGDVTQETAEDAEPTEDATTEEAPVKKAKPKKKAPVKKKTPAKKKAEPKKEEEAPVDTEDIAKFKEETQKILDSDKSLAGKKTALSALVRKYAKRLNLVGQDAAIVDRIRRAKSQRVMANAVNDFSNKATRRAQIPGDSKVVNTAVELKKKLREINSAIRKTKSSVNKKMQELTKGVKQTLKESGIDSRSKVYKQILNKLATLNINSPKSILRFEMYVDKVVGDAKFEQKLKDANIIRKKVKRLARGNSVSVNLTEAAKSYAKLDPLMVENIDAHIELGKNIAKGLENVRLDKEGNVVGNEVFNKNQVENYVKAETSRQEDINAEETKIILEALGIDTSNLTNAQAKEILDAQKEVKETGKAKTNDFIDKVSRAFNQYKVNLVAEAKRRGLTKSQIDAVKRFSEVDLTILNNENKRETVIKAMNIMNNFYENGDIAGMDAISLAYEGARNVKADVKRGVSGRRSTLIGRFYGSVVNQLAMEFERVFGGQNEGFKILEASGVNKLVSGAASARTIVNNYFNEYNKLRKNKYQTAENTFERGIYAFVARVDSGVETAEAFKRRKGLVEQSLEKYKTTDEKTYKVLQKVYDKILKDANSFQEVEAKMDAENIKLVNYYRNKFSENFSEFQEMNLSLRNKKLDPDQNYFPDLYFSTEGVKVSVAAKFHKLNYDSESSAGIETERPYKLPKDRNINFNFDEVAYNKMNEMVVDTKTAAALAQIDAYMNSPEFETIAGSEKNAARLRDRVNGYRENVKGDNHYVSAIEKDAQTAIMRYLDPIFKLGYAKALFSTMQPVKQAASALVNTLFQAPLMLMKPDSAKTFVPGSAINKAINRSGMAIANRGADTRYEENTEEKVALQLSKSRSLASKVYLALGVPSEVALKVSVGAADSAAARASFIAFYKKRLKKMGLTHKNIDWANHQWNEEAASYADMMVSRNQAPSDTRLRGELFTKKGMGLSLLRKTILPFSNFIMAQKARMYSDVRALTNPRTTREDRVAASGSLAGTAAEMAVYHAIGYAVGRVIMNKVAEVLGYEEEKDGEMVDFLGYAIPKKDFEQFMAYRGSTMFADVFSPIPIADNVVKRVANYVIEETTGKEDFIKIWDSENQTTDYLGTAGIAVEGFMEMYDTYQLYTTGEYEDEDLLGNKVVKRISPESQSILKDLYIYQSLAAFGLIPVDAERYVSKVKSYAKRMGPDHKFSDAYIEQLYGEVMEKHDLTVDQMKQYVSYSVDDNGRRSGEWNPSIKYDDKTKAYLRIHNREKYLLYQDIDNAMKAAEKERVDSRTIERALEYFTIKQLYVLKENEPEQYEVIRKKYDLRDNQIDDRMQELVDVEDEIIMRMQARNQTSR